MALYIATVRQRIYVHFPSQLKHTIPAITLGSGVQWQEAYDAVFAKGRNIVGGIAPGASVGAAGGWLQGGGHSILSPQHGLGEYFSATSVAL